MSKNKRKELLEKREKVTKDVDIAQVMKKSYLEFAVASYMRMIPNAIDGLKPSQRRILFTMKNMKADDFTKSADIVGQSMQLIPHGDSSIYQTLIYMAQPDRCRNTLVKGQGNIGYITQSLSEYAAARYTEAKMTDYLKDFYFTEDFEFTDMEMTYKGLPNVLEPVFLPTLLPMVLINGTNGITSGFSTRVVPHTLKSVAKAYIDYIKNRGDVAGWHKMEKRIIRGIKVDFPNPCKIVKNSENGLLLGKGKLTARGELRVEPGSRGKNTIVITELPYMVEIPKFVEQCYSIFNKDNRLYGILDESGKEGVLINIVLKKDVPVEKAIDELLIKTSFMTSYNYSMLFIKGQEVVRMGILPLFEHHYQNKKRVLTKYFLFKKEDLFKKKICLDGAIYILGNKERRDEFIKMLERSDKESILNKIKRKWKLEESVGEYLINKKFSSLLKGVEDMKKEQLKISEEYESVLYILNNIDEYMIEKISTTVKKYR